MDQELLTTLLNVANWHRLNERDRNLLIRVAKVQVEVQRAQDRLEAAQAKLVMAMNAYNEPLPTLNKIEFVGSAQ